MPPADRHLALAPLAAAAATGRSAAVAASAHAAIASGCTAEEVRETLLTLVPFCGYPRALDAFAAAREVLKGARIVPDHAASSSRGVVFFLRVYGMDAGKVRNNLRYLDPDVAEWIVEHAYSQVLSRPGLDPSLRERVGVVLLAAQGLRVQLSGHVRGALNFGATVAEVAAFVEAAAPFIDAGESEFARETVARCRDSTTEAL